MNMALFHNRTEGQPVNNWWDNGNNQIAFYCGDKGFVAINNESGSLVASLQTGLPAGEYCNLLGGNDYCSGGYVTVDGSGKASLNVPGMKAVSSPVVPRPALRWFRPAGHQVQQHEPARYPQRLGQYPHDRRCQPCLVSHPHPDRQR